MTEATRQLSQAVQFLAARCDGAVTEDGQGFNGTDTNFGRYMATLPAETWTAAQSRAVWEMIGKYRGQLEAGGIDFASIPVPERVNGDARSQAQAERAESNREARAAAAKRVRLEGDEIVIAFDYDAELVAAARSLPRRRYDGRTKTNRVPRAPLSAVAVNVFIDQYGPFTVDADARVELDRLAAEAATTEEEIAAQPSAWVELEGSRAAAFFDYDRDAIALAKRAGGRYDGKRTKAGSKSVWTFAIEPSNAKQLRDFIEALPEDRRVAAEVSERIDSLAEAAEARLESSRAKDADFTVEGLGAELRPFQRAGVAYLADARRSFLADDMGTGKTVQGCALMKHEDEWPVVVVSPNAVKLTWVEHVQGPLPYAPEGWLPGKKAVALSGETPSAADVRGADVVVVNWDILVHWLPVLIAMRPRGLIFDESHYGKDHKALYKPKPGKPIPGAKRARAMLELSEVVRAAGGWVINASGTPLLNRPIELAPQLEAIGRLDDFGGFWRYAKRYCGAFRDKHGWDFSGSANLEELNEKLRATCYIRRTKAEVLPELPPKVISHVHVDIDNETEYRAAEADVIAYLLEEAEGDLEFERELDDLAREMEDDGRGRDEIERAIRARKSERREEIAKRGEQAEHLVRINKLRQLIAKGKTKPVIEWAKTFLESTDEKLVIMAYHRDQQVAFAKALRGYNPAVIEGGMGDKVKEQERKFQTDPDCRVVVVSLRAGGVGLTLTAASNIAMTEQDWTPTVMEQGEDRCHRIGSEEHESINVWYLMGRTRSNEPTVDDDMRELIADKLEVTSTVIDGTARDQAKGESVLAEVIERLKARGASRRQEAMV